MIKEYLTDLEIAKIESFCADKDMYEAVHKVMLATTYYAGTLRKGETLEPRNQAFDLIAKAAANGEKITNEQLGEELRGLFFGVDTVEQGFARLKEIKGSVVSPIQDINEAI